MTNHSNPLWRYEDSRGIEHTGHFHKHTDHGGSDITYFFHDCKTGELSLVSGSRLKTAKILNEKCGNN